MKIIVTGANGLLGQKIIDIFHQESDHEVFGLDIMNPNGLPEAQGSFLTVDITDRNLLKEIVRAYHPDAIINTCSSDLSTLVMNSVVVRHVSTLHFHYPHWPEGAPSKFLFKPKDQRKPKVEKNRAKKQNPAPESKKVVEVHKVSKRNSRYNGRKNISPLFFN